MLNKFSKPTPKKWKVRAWSFNTFMLALSGTAAAQNIPWLALGFVAAGSLAVFLVECFTEEIISTSPDIVGIMPSPYENAENE